jgi:hypothetical protein
MNGSVLATNNFNKFVVENNIPVQTIQELINSCVVSPSKFAQVKFEFGSISAYLDIERGGEITLLSDKDYS